jgi:hypothetical protein
MSNYFPAKDNDFANWLATFLIIKACRGIDTSGPSNIAVAGVAIPVALVV